MDRTNRTDRTDTPSRLDRLSLNGATKDATARICGNCAHWSKLPPNPQQIGLKSGECREGPPHVTIIIAQGPGGVSPVGQAAQFPNLPDTFPACGRFTPVPLTISE